MWYIALISVTYITTSTGAYFNVSKNIEGTLTAGYWLPSIIFVNKGNQNQKEYSCPAESFQISTIVQNNSNVNMSQQGNFYVYFVKNGNPEQNGVYIGEGTIPKILAGEEHEITIDVPEEGMFMFKAFKHVEENEEYAIWSEKVIVKCKNQNAIQDTKDEFESVELDNEAKENEKNEEELEVNEDSKAVKENRIDNLELDGSKEKNQNVEEIEPKDKASVEMPTEIKEIEVLGTQSTHKEEDQKQDEITKDEAEEMD